MFRTLGAAALAVALLTLPALAQQEPLQPPSSQINTALVGLPIVSSDGERIGRITSVEVDNGAVIPIGEIDRPMGIGSDVVEIRAYVQRADHIEVALTAAEVRDTIARAKQ